MGRTHRVNEVELSIERLAAILARFEAQNQLDSASFMARYVEGQYAGVLTAARWAAYYRTYEELVGQVKVELGDDDHPQ